MPGSISGPPKQSGSWISRGRALMVLAIWVFTSTGCDALPWVIKQAPETLVATADVTASPEGESSVTEPDGLKQMPGTPTAELDVQPDLLRLWLPPQFDPMAETPAGKVLRTRLEQFTDRYPDLHLDIRIKAENGPGGLLAALSAASVSAPLTLPDVVALPRSLLEAAALKGVVYPMDGLPVAEVDGFLTETDWYPYAVQMGRLQDNTFGLPFASDLLVMAAWSVGQDATEQVTPTPQPTPTVDADADQTLPAEWVRLIEGEAKIAFPAADPQALYTLLLYRSLGGPWVDAEGRPYLDYSVLEQVLRFYQQASQAEVLPSWLTQYETDDQVWEVFTNGEADYLVTWASQLLAAESQVEASLVAEPLPNLVGQPYTLASGWVWAVASPNPTKRALAGELAAFLVESSFLAEWNAAAGYLPPLASALQNWEPSDWRSQVDEISGGAELLPPGDVLSVLGPLLRQATVDVLKLQVEPAAAAQAAIAALNSP